MTELKRGEAFAIGLRRAESDALNDLKSSIVRNSGKASENYDYIDDELAASAKKRRSEETKERQHGMNTGVRRDPTAMF